MSNNNPAKLLHLKGPEFRGSWWNRSKSMTTTMRVGKYTPINYWDVPGPSLFKLKNSIRMESMPAVSPLYGGFQLITKYIFAPYRLYIPKLRKNQHLRTNEFPNLNLPFVELTNVFGSGTYIEDFTYWSFAGSLWERLGLGWGCMSNGLSFNGSKPVEIANVSSVSPFNYNFSQKCGLMPLLVYMDSWLHGEYNPQDVRIPLDYHYMAPDPDEDGTAEYGFRWVHYQDMIAFINYFAFGDDLYYPEGDEDEVATPIYQNGIQFSLNKGKFKLLPGYDVFTRAVRDELGPVNSSRIYTSYYHPLRNMVSGVGLLPVTYKGDYFSSWFSEAGIANIKNFVVDNGMSLLSLRKENSDMLVAALQMVAGDKYTDILQWQYDSYIELKDHPILIGKDVLSFGMQDVMNTTGSASSDPLGQAGSKTRVYNHDINRPVSVKTKEPGMVMVCSYIIPSVVYYQGTNRFLFKEKVEDLWKPQYDAKGFQDTLRGELINPFVFPNVSSYSSDLNIEIPWVDANKIAFSYVPLGWEYMSDYDQISGGMRTEGFSTWTLRRNVDSLGTIDGRPWSLGLLEGSYKEVFMTTYILSWMYNNNFANVSLSEAENFILKYDFNVSCYQPMSHQLITKTI